MGEERQGQPADLSTPAAYSPRAPTRFTDLAGEPAHPSYEQFLEQGKPLLLTDRYSVEYIRGLGDKLAASAESRVAELTDFNGNSRLVFWQPGKEADARALISLYERASNTPDFHRAVGRLLGYPEEEIEAFITGDCHYPHQRLTTFVTDVQMERAIAHVRAEYAGTNFRVRTESERRADDRRLFERGLFSRYRPWGRIVHRGSQLLRRLQAGIRALVRSL